jgi:BMFP domain-containing protein YqiC
LTATPADPHDELTDRLHRELSGRIQNARGDVKRLNAVVREYFDGMDLLHRDEGRVEIRPVLRPAQLQRFLDQGDFPEGVVAPEINPHTPS